jgi:tRNA threonylcarbamoyladenosine biosynthesis protein TsaB
MELAIDTSTETASVALSSQGEVTIELTWHAGQNHTAEVISKIVCLLDQAKLNIKDINSVIVAKGPGSFNGLRIGMSLAKGFALALNLPMVGISTLEVEAYPYAFTLLPICPIQNAGRGEIATALFRIKQGKWCRLVEEHIATLDSLLTEMKGQTIFCGKIPQEVKSQLRKRLGRRALIIKGTAGFRRAGYLAELGWWRLKDGDFNHSPTLEPLYLRRPSITTSRRLPNLGK